MRPAVISLKKLRERSGLSLRKLAEKSGVHFVSLARIEAGMLDPRLSTLRRLGAALGVTISELVGDKPSRKGGRYGTYQAKRRVLRRVSRPR